MTGPARAILCLVCLYLNATYFSQSSCAEPRPLSVDEPSSQATPWQDDAHLYDIQFVGHKSGWAVGDHGTIWHTDDAGEHWSLQQSPINCSLRRLCFLTDQVGWIVGGGMSTYGRGHFGIVLHTRDGGQTWKRQSTGSLPTLTYVRFFGLDEGVAVGLPNSKFPNGVMHTADGGQTWEPFQGNVEGSIRAADFYRADDGGLNGVLAGRQGITQMARGIELLPNTQPQPSLRGYHQIHLAPDHVGWLVGDGGLALRTPNGGVTWKSPIAPLPNQLRNIADFKAVATYKDHVWIAGSPGNVIWHSANWGESWDQQKTGQSLPVYDLFFGSPETGWAVGALGQMLKTDDGGQTWQAVRGAGRRLALLTIHSRIDQLPFLTVAQQAGDLGFRSLAYLPTRHDVGPAGSEHNSDDFESQQAVLAAGGAGALIDWQLPVARPDIEHDYKKLVADLQRRTEGQLPDMMLSKLVAVLRTWQPEIILLDQSASDDAATRLLNQAVRKAVEQAADETAFPEHQQLAGLHPWKVRRIWEQLPSGSVGEVNVDPYQYLPRLQATAQEAASPARSMVLPKSPLEFGRESFRSTYNAGSEATETEQTHPSLFAGLSLLPDSETRRPLALYDIEQQEQFAKRIRQQRNVESFTDYLLKKPEMASQMIAQIEQLSEGLTPSQAAFQLSQMSEKYRKRANWNLAETTAIEIINRYPQEPIALETMQWLIQLWGGAEPAWQRLRSPDVRKFELQFDREMFAQRIEQAAYQTTIDPRQRNPAALNGPDPLSVKQTTGDIRADRSMNEQQAWSNKKAESWQGQAVKLAAMMRRSAPDYFLKPEVQFPLAAVLRKRGSYRLADGAYRQFPAENPNDLWNQTAESELWMVHQTHLPPKTVGHLRRTRQRPHLDGLLSDPCWQEARELFLTSEAIGESAAPADAGIVLMAYDNEFLYLAASIPKADATYEKPENQIRKHDADLTSQDRLKLWIDIDRDYATWYTLAVDHRGQTADKCWTDEGWNPEWYVSAESDDSHWRIEAAIKLEELTPTPPASGTVWAVGLSRIIPSVGVQSWTHPASVSPRPETFGLLKFE